MPSYLCVSITFLDREFHGRGDGGEPEWPASPLRVFQSLVAASAARWREALFHEYAAPALRWLEQLPPPVIITPDSHTAQPYRISVPNNAMDVVAAAWTRGNYTGKDAQPATHRAIKPVRPTRLLDGDAVHYLWPLPEPLSDEVRGFAEVVSAASRSIVALGWGIDLVAGNGRILPVAETEKIRGERWLPVNDSSAETLRTPVAGTLAALMSRHQAFLGRLSAGGGFAPVPAVSVFKGIGYRRDKAPASRPYAAFSILRMDASGFRPFDPVRSTHIVAGMVRHATAASAVRAGWADGRINVLIHGHSADGNDKARSEDGTPRLAYLPLPSIERHGSRGVSVGAIRRILVVGPAAGEVGWVRRAINNQELIDEDTKQPTSILSLLPERDRNVLPYVRPSSVWATVTPVVLPGYGDRDLAKTERLLRKAIAQAGLPAALAERAVLDWGEVGFLPGLDLSQRYAVPAHISHYPRYHMRIQWPADVKVPGPLAIGGGRFGGMGLFAAVDSR